MALSISVAAVLLPATDALAQRQMERLSRGVVAVRTNSTRVYIGWRMLGTEPDDIGFNLYRVASGVTNKLNGSQPLTNSTDFSDAPPSLTVANAYFVRPVLGGVEQAPSASFTLAANAPIQQYLAIPLQIPPGGTTPDGVNYTYSANDCSAGDLDGDGEYEIILKWDPSNSKDNSQSGYTGNVFLDAYKLDGTRLWRIDLGRNIRAGAHYTQFMVYDLDGDGKAEVACKTAPGTVDGLGKSVVMPGDEPNADFRNTDGYILSGPEYLTIFDGRTGGALATTNYVPPRGNVSSWGDSYGNRVDRFLACVAYLDGIRPSLVMCRGYYTRAVLAAWDWRNGQLTQRWVFDSDDGTPGNSDYRGQGSHCLTVGDVDGDGKDEITYGACAIDHDGKGLYTTRLGHGDALHMSDMDPNRPGLEVWMVHEDPASYGIAGLEARDARTGALRFGVDGQGADIGRGVAMDIDPRYRGYECWGARGGLYNAAGIQISSNRPGPMNFAVWWDADLSRELLDGTTISKWNYASETTSTLLSPSGLASNNGTKATPCLSADLFGDWREEVIWRTSDNQQLRIYTTTIPATNRFRTLMHDPQYRLAIAWQNVAYNQPPHPGFYLGEGMSSPPIAPISSADLVWRGGAAGNAWDLGATANWLTNGIWVSNSIATVFANGRSVLFDATGSNTSPVSLSGVLQPASLTVHSPADYVFSGSGNLAGNMKLVKAGTGTLTINTTNSFTGPTFVAEGTLLVNGSLNASPVTVQPGVWLNSSIGGRGVLGQGLTLCSQCGLLPGGANTAAVLTVSNGVALQGGAVCHFDLSDDPTGVAKTNDHLHVLGNLVLAGTNTITIHLLNESLGAGTYTLIDYSGTLTGGLTNLQLAGIYGGTLTNPPGQIALIANCGRCQPAELVWLGGPGNLWDAGVSPNWLSDINLAHFEPLDSVRFDSAGAANSNVVLDGVLSPSAVTVDAASDYTFSGTGSITGNTGLLKTNTGILTILATNDYLGPTLIAGGTLQISQMANGGLPSGLGASSSEPTNLVIGSATLRYTGPTVGVNRGATLTAANSALEVAGAGTTLSCSGVLTGNGALLKLGPGGLTLMTVNTFTGGIDLTEGTLTLVSVNAPGSGPIKLQGGTLMLNASGSPATYGNALNLLASSTLVTAGSGNNNQALSGPWSGNQTLFINTGNGGTCSVRSDLSGFSGSVCLLGSGYFRWFGSSGSSVAAFDLGTNSPIMHTRDGGIVALGSLAGGANTILRGASSTANPTTFLVGGNNRDTLFAGTIADGTKGTTATTAITKVGTGAWTLTGAHTYTGPTTISNGTLVINGTLGGTGLVSVVAGMLAGNGAINGPTTIAPAGTLSPGNDIGVLTINNTVSLLGGVIMQINKALRTNDLLNVTGDLNCGGSLIITNLAGIFCGGDTFKLFNAPAYLGAFTNLALPPLPPSQTWDTTRLAIDGTIAVLGAAPVFESITRSGTDLVINGTGGTPNASFYLLSSTNLALPAAQWSRLATNQFIGNGDFAITIPVEPAVPQRFYLLQLR